MRDRIYGLERETAFSPHRVYMDNKTVVRAMADSLRPRTRNGVLVVPAIFDFMANGGRVYWDTGDHYEIATPECRNARDLVVWDKAGERILETIARTMNAEAVPLSRLHAGITFSGGCTFLKSNFAPNAEKSRDGSVRFIDAIDCASWGSHLSVLLDRRAISPWKAVNILAPFCFASYWLSGSGSVWMTEDGRMRYSFSQRAPFVKRIYYNSATDPEKPMFLMRHESHADSEKYFRLQVVGLDSSLCEWPTYVCAGIIGILLRMIEDQVIEERDYCPSGISSLHSELLAMKTKTMWLGGEQILFLFGGEEHTVASLHRKFYLEPILLFRASLLEDAARTGQAPLWSDEEEDVVRKYEFFIKTLETATSSLELAAAFAPYVDWAAKLHYLILPDMRRHDYSFERSPETAVRGKSGSTDGEMSVWSRMRYVDSVGYHDVRQDTGLYYKLVRRGLIERIVTDTEVARATAYPPSDTRAAGRDARIRALLAENVMFDEMSWRYLRYCHRNGSNLVKITEVNLDPFDPSPAAFQISPGGLANL